MILVEQSLQSFLFEVPKRLAKTSCRTSRRYLSDITIFELFSEKENYQSISAEFGDRDDENEARQPIVQSPGHQSEGVSDYRKPA